jgi:hypothetical protein
MKKLIYSIALIASCSFLSSALCSKSDSDISPARNLEGTWNTVSTAPTFYYYSDICGNYSRVAQFQMGVQWIVTKTGTNTVDIEMRKTSSSAVQLLVSSSCALYVPIVTPIFLNGEISSSQLNVYDSYGYLVGTFNFTTNNITGGFNSNLDKYCGVYCSGAGTDATTVTLVK